MSFLFHEPFEPALYVRDRAYAPPPKTATSALAGHRRAMAQLIAGETFEDGFEAWRYGRRPGARIVLSPTVTSFNPARRRFSDALFEDETPALQRRGFAKGYVASVPSGRAFALHRRLAATLAAFPEDGWGDPQPWTRGRFGGTGFTLSNGRTASFTVTFTGQASDDPYRDEAFAAAATTGLAADPNQALAVQTDGNFTGQSASRRG